MDKEQQRHDELEAPLLPGDGGKAAAASGSAYALVCSLVASAISVIYGYNRGVMSGAQKFVQDDLGISDAQIEVLIGATSIYSLVGSLAAGWACDRAGRRRTMALSAAMFFAGSAITSVAGGYAALMAGQLVAGVACGFGLVVAPVYIAEMAPAASRGFLSSIPEAQLSLLETQLSDSQKKLTSETELRVAAEERVKSLENAASEAAAKLVTLTSEHAKEKDLLVQRAEEAEKRLQPISAELGGLKLHIRQMCHAIFGPRSKNLKKDPATQLKAAYTFLEQLYTGSRRAIHAAFYGKENPSTIKGVLETLSTLPAQLKFVRESSARIATMHTMARAKAHYEDLELQTLIGGFPETYKGKTIDQPTYSALKKETFIPASQLVKEMKLARIQLSYGEDGKKEKLNPLPPLSLTPAGRKDEFAPAIESSNLIDAEDVFEAFADVDWDADDDQINPSVDADQTKGDKTQE